MDYVETALSLGAEKARVIDPSSVETGLWTYYKCKFGCPGYGARWCCPPNTMSHGEMRQILSEYKTGLLFQCRDPDRGNEIAKELERLLFLSGYYKAMAFGAGPCRICEACAVTRCRFPEKSAPSMEACGVDVFATVRKHGFTVEVLQNRDEAQVRFGLILIE